MKFYWDRLVRRPGGARPRATVTDAAGRARPKANFEEAFGFAGGGGAQGTTQMRGSYDENIRLAPYAYPGSGRRRAGSADDGVSEGSATPELGDRVQPRQQGARMGV